MPRQGNAAHTASSKRTNAARTKAAPSGRPTLPHDVRHEINGIVNFYSPLTNKSHQKMSKLHNPCLEQATANEHRKVCLHGSQLPPSTRDSFANLSDMVQEHSQLELNSVRLAPVPVDPCIRPHCCVGALCQYLQSVLCLRHLSSNLALRRSCRMLANILCSLVALSFYNWSRRWGCWMQEPQGQAERGQWSGAAGQCLWSKTLGRPRRGAGSRYPLPSVSNSLRLPSEAHLDTSDALVGSHRRSRQSRRTRRRQEERHCSGQPRRHRFLLAVG